MRRWVRGRAHDPKTPIHASAELQGVGGCRAGHDCRGAHQRPANPGQRQRALPGLQRRPVRSSTDNASVGAGPGTIAEALISGLPILLNGNVPCQEEGNIPYVVDNGCGMFERDPPKIAAIIDEWFSAEGKELLQRMARNAKALGRPDALMKIVRDLAQLAEHETVEQRHKELQTALA